MCHNLPIETTFGDFAPVFNSVSHNVNNKLWPTPLPTNTVTPNPLYTSLPARTTYMHIICFVCCFYLLFQLHIICFRLSGRKVAIKRID